MLGVMTHFYVEQDSSITVAFDDVPEEGLNSPLRLEKVANEVVYLLACICLCILKFLLILFAQLCSLD